jgi:hypothetical protein
MPQSHEMEPEANDPLAGGSFKEGSIEPAADEQDDEQSGGALDIEAKDGTVYPLCPPIPPPWRLEGFAGMLKRLFPRRRRVSRYL